MASGGRCQVSVLFFFVPQLFGRLRFEVSVLGFLFLGFQVLLFQVPGS